MQSAAQKLLSELVRDQGTHISMMIRRGVETPDWSVMKEPSDVRSAVELVAKEFYSFLREVSQVFPLKEADTSNIPTTASQGDLSRYSLSTIQHLTGGPKRTPIIGGIIEEDANSVLSGVTKIVLKSFVECVRLCTFNKYGYQQMQVDTSYMRIVLESLHFDQERLLERMLDDVSESTSWRCFEPVGMNAKVCVLADLLLFSHIPDHCGYHRAKG
jgi:vacuolar protein sorting-associated protein 51